MSSSHIRRCHVCGQISEDEGGPVRKCSHCGKHLAPFYYFDESKLEGLEERGPYLSTWKRGALENHFNPLWGLSAYWENNESQSRGYSSS